MAKNMFSFVLEDDLLVEYHKFMNPNGSGGVYDKDVLKKLLSYHIYPFLYNKSQIDRTKLVVSDNIRIQLAKSNLKNLDLETLADQTVFKCILSNDKDMFPYININSDKVKTSITGTFFSTENRDKAMAHIKKLCAEAHTITLHDKYLSRAEAHNICDLLPHRNGLAIRIHYQDIKEKTMTTYCFADVQSELSSGCNQWTIEPKDLLVNSHHDRYLIIDDKLAVILTSGFANLFADTKDCTYIVSPIERNPLMRP